VPANREAGAIREPCTVTRPEVSCREGEGSEAPLGFVEALDLPEQDGERGARGGEEGRVLGAELFDVVEAVFLRGLTHQEEAALLGRSEECPLRG
jgi:hypothetical protein